MRRLVYVTLIFLALGAVGLLLLPALTGTAKIVAPDAFAPAPDNIPKVEPGTYLPEGLKDIRIGMSLVEFLESGHAQNVLRKDHDFRITIEKAYADQAFSAATFYFGAEGNRPLYEIIIEYPPNYDLHAHLATAYGEPTHEGEWRYRDHDDYRIMIWTFLNKVVIAANMRGTEHQYKK